ncbi:hypothetical protein [Mucilaginibacter sp. UYCu711]|uniref:hypothetical protein n=1 Tax=Mucilaginibacter sp. UYCu711 TaxID=3156339 RepID=UPI003D195D42
MTGISSAFAQGITPEQAQNFANKLLISKKYKATVKKVLPPINNIQVLLLSVPYREYPSVIILNKTPAGWIRLFECLAPGIQDKPSGLLDWHTKGLGVDFSFDKESELGFNDKKIKTIVESALKKAGAVVIPYYGFIHMNTAEEKDATQFTPYTIDKTNYLIFANSLFENNYNTYKQSECMMFDTPQVIDCDFTLSGSSYIIKAITANHQTWIYTFDSIDSQNRYLVNKKIFVKN